MMNAHSKTEQRLREELEEARKAGADPAEIERLRKTLESFLDSLDQPDCLSGGMPRRRPREGGV